MSEKIVEGNTSNSIKNMDELVSVIVPVYNVEKYIARCLESIVAQTYHNIEIIVIDDGSTDLSGSICDEFGKRDSRIIVIHQENMGLSGARNRGLDVMRGQWVTFIDSDDFVHRDFIKYLLYMCIKHNVKVSQCGFVRGTDNNFTEEEEIVKERKWKFNELYLSPSRQFRVIACAKMYDATFFQIYRYPYGKINEDEDTTFKILYEAEYIVISNRKLYYYYMSNDSIMRKNRGKINFDFLDILTDRIFFLQSRDEEKLVSVTEKELCIRLMLNYFTAVQNGFTSDQDLLFKLYRQHFHNIDWMSVKSIKEKLALAVFDVFPRLFAFVENNLHIVDKNRRIREKR